jgi:ribosomal protein S18 acetylase RimI-like enzyme
MVVYRLCEPGDARDVAGLLRQLQEHASTAELPDESRLAAILAEMTGRREVYWNLVAAVPAGRVVGFLSMVAYRTLFHAGGTALINELVVHRDYRGRGIGRELVRRAVSEAEGRGMDELEVGTEQTNTAARRFYAACGFDQEYVLLGRDLSGDGS